MFVFEIWVTLPLVLSAIPQTAFVLLYGLPCLGAGQWWRDPVGRALFFKSLTLAALLDTVAARIIYQAAEAEDVVVVTAFPTAGIDRFGALLYWGIFAAIVYQLVVLIRQRLHDRQP